MGKSYDVLSAPDSMLAAARRAAKRDGAGLNQLIDMALAEKAAALGGEEVFTRRVARADRARFLEVPEHLGPEPPRAGDELDTDRSDRFMGTASSGWQRSTKAISVKSCTTSLVSSPAFGVAPTVT